MHRYELGEDPAEKFWETWIDGVTLYTRFGEIGSQGQTQLKKCATPDVAAQEQARFVAGKEKLEKLDLTENYISDEMADRLIATFGDVVQVSEQGDDPEEDRYVQVAE
jgi:predicted DNA-binding WGR domain protein